MKKYIFLISFLFACTLLVTGQSTDQLISNCVMNAGPDARYLKDFRVQLGAAGGDSDLRFKANISLWKNTKYRFSMCNTEGSKGQLILSIKDATNKTVISSFDKTSGKTYSYIDFVCNKSGIYQLNYDFLKGQQGSGIGVVSMIK
jgi:hypothetical protein